MFGHGRSCSCSCCCRLCSSLFSRWKQIARPARTTAIEYLVRLRRSSERRSGCPRSSRSDLRRDSFIICSTEASIDCRTRKCARPPLGWLAKATEFLERKKSASDSVRIAKYSRMFFALARYLQTKCKIFDLTTQRFEITSVLTRHALGPKCLHFSANAAVIALAASVRPHDPFDSDRHDGNPTGTIRGKKISSYKNRILTRRLT